tara:strand:+ start:397 stop:699 length:303 start_codon:yes stop_codon:yes gene_type:complete
MRICYFSFDRITEYMTNLILLLNDYLCCSSPPITVETQLICFSRLHENERAAIPTRVARAAFEVKQLKEREARLQAFYGELDREYTALVEGGDGGGAMEE